DEAPDFRSELQSACFARLQQLSPEDRDEVLQALQAGAEDQEGQEKPQDVRTFLKGKISDTDLEKFMWLLTNYGKAQDQPPDFPGKPIPGGTMEPITRAMDAASQASFQRRFPTIRPIPVLPSETRHDQRPSMAAKLRAAVGNAAADEEAFA